MTSNLTDPMNDFLPESMTDPMTFPIPVDHLDLSDSLFCGQAFRWKRSGDSFTGVVGGSVVELRREPGSGTISVASSGPFDPVRYFRLDDDLAGIRNALSGDPVLQPIIQRFPGLRLLRQDPYETLISFILSQASGIRRISGTVEALSRRFGEKLRIGERTWYSFPTPERLSRVRESTFRSMGTGYRAPYLRAAARTVASGEVDLGSLAGGGCGSMNKSGNGYENESDTGPRVPLDEARAILMDLPGVGRKVADCVLLFSLDRMEVFPVDRWIERVVSHHYFAGAKVGQRRILEWAEERFGADAGYAQQYLFHHGRTEGRERFVCGDEGSPQSTGI